MDFLHDLEAARSSLGGSSRQRSQRYSLLECSLMLEERSVRVNQVLSGSAIAESLTTLIETRRTAMPACKPSRSASGSRRATWGGGLVPRVRQLPVCDVELS